MENINITKLIEYVKINNFEKYPKLMNQVEYLLRERIKLVGNDLRKFLSINSDTIDKEKVCDTVTAINEIAADVGFDFYVNPKWDTVEKFLRMSILDDISKEFNKQNDRNIDGNTIEMDSIKEQIRRKLVAIHNNYCSEKIDPNLKFIDLFKFCETNDVELTRRLEPVVRIATTFQGIPEAMQNNSEEQIKAFIALNEELELVIQQLNNKEV